MLCERVVLERKYNATCLALATHATPTAVTFREAEYNFRRFAVAIDAHARRFVDSL